MLKRTNESSTFQGLKPGLLIISFSVVETCILAYVSNFWILLSFWDVDFTLLLCYAVECFAAKTIHLKQIFVHIIGLKNLRISIVAEDWFEIRSWPISTIRNLWLNFHTIQIRSSPVFLMVSWSIFLNFSLEIMSRDLFDSMQSIVVF